MNGPQLLHAEAFRPQGKTDAEIFHGLRVHVRALLVSFGVTHAAYEEPLRTDLMRKGKKEGEGPSPMSSMKTYLRLYGIRAHVIEVCHSLNIHCQEVHQGTWRARFLKDMDRKGADLKDLALERCQQFGWPVFSKDAAEACGVCHWLGAELDEHNGALPGDLFFNAA